MTKKEKDNTQESLIKRAENLYWLNENRITNAGIAWYRYVNRLIQLKLS